MTGHIVATTPPGAVAPEMMVGVMLARIGATKARRVPILEAHGLVLAEPVIAGCDLPRFDNSAMDGVAVAHQSLQGCPVSLPVVGSSMAGEPWEGTLQPGQAVAIATGAPVPAGADTVVPVELTAAQGSRVRVLTTVARGSHVRRAGEDVMAGSVVVPAGHQAGPGQLAACAALGLRELAVHPRPLVAILPTGSEVRPAGHVLGPAGIYDAVSLPLGSLLRELGAVARHHPPVRDDPEALLAAVREAAAGADLVITVGGVSAGKQDFVRSLNTVGKVDAYQVALRPARPFAFGTMYGGPLIGLPGNPAAALAAFEVLARPVVLQLLGRQPAARLSVEAVLTQSLPADPPRMHLLRMQVWWRDGVLLARPAGAQGAGMLHSLAAANAWARLPGGEGLPAGARIDVEMLGDPFPADPGPA